MLANYMTRTNIILKAKNGNLWKKIAGLIVHTLVDIKNSFEDDSKFSCVGHFLLVRKTFIPYFYEIKFYLKNLPQKTAVSHSSKNEC